jgi:hypothetical protein
MGACHVRVLIQPALAGCEQLQGTNISAGFSPDGRFLVVHDATVALIFDCRTGLVGHLVPPRDWYVRDVRLIEQHLEVGLFRDSSIPAPAYGPFHLERIVAESPGFGPVTNGRMPSLYKPAWIESSEAAHQSGRNV